MKTIIKYLFILFFTFIINSSYANQMDFYWEENSSWDIIKQSNADIINDSLNDFYNTTWLNTDIVILWKWDECYLETNFDTCVQEKHTYASDLIIVMSMKSDIKTRWDTRTLIKDDYKEILTPGDLKYVQDLVIPYFKRSDFTWGLKCILWSILDLVDDKCEEVWLEKWCNVIKLSKDYHSFIAEKEYEKKYNAMMKTVYYIIFVVLIILTYILSKKYYIRSINDLYKDIKYKITNLWEYEIFVKDKEKISKELDSIKIVVKNKLWDLNKNAFNLRKFYKTQKNTLSFIENNLSEMQKSFSERRELKEKVSTMKKIDL